MGNRLLVNRAEIYFCSIGINGIEPNAAIGIDKLVNPLVAFILPGGKDSVLDQSANALIAFVISKSHELADVADSIVSNCGTISLVDGAAETAGAKGMHCDNDNYGQWATSGDDGSNGTKGSNGSAGKTISIP